MKFTETAEKRKIFPIIGAAIVFTLCLIVLYGGKNVGLSDNGDFRRVLLANNIEYKDEDGKYYLFNQFYNMNNTEEEEGAVSKKVEGNTIPEKLSALWQENTEEDIYTSPHFLFIKISKVINFFANRISGHPETEYNIFWLALLYVFMLSLAAFGIFDFFNTSKWYVKLTVFAVFVFMFCDAGYILYFNSFYGEALQYIALMMLISVGLLIYKRPTVIKALCFFVSLYFFAGSKLANIPYSIIICIFSVTILYLRKDMLFRIAVMAMLVICACSVMQLYSSIPAWMQNDTTYQSVFYGILRKSDNPEQDLKFLGTKEEYAVLANTTAYDDADMEIDISDADFEENFYGKVSKLDIFAFYVCHPIRLFKNLTDAIKNSAYIRPPNLGNMTDVQMEMTKKFSLWSNFRLMLRFPYNPLVIFVLYTIVTVYIIFIDYYYIKRRKNEPVQSIYMMAGINVLVLGLWINLILPVVGNGQADIAKHMFLFVNGTDIFMAMMIVFFLRLQLRYKVCAASGVALLTMCCNYSLPKQTIEFGTYAGSSIKWDVVETLNDGTAILITKDPVAEMSFDRESNMWELSDLREWLNTEFLAEFTDEEKTRIKRTANAMILSADQKQLAEAGNHVHYWNCTKSMAGDLAKTAYNYYLDDYVYIPTLDMLEQIGNDEDSWVLCSYGNNSTMERYINKYGFVLHTSVQNKKSVRAVIRYNMAGEEDEGGTENIIAPTSRAMYEFREQAAADMYTSDEIVDENAYYSEDTGIGSANSSEQ